MNKNENYLFTLYMDYRNKGQKDLKEEIRLIKRAKKMHSEMVWYPRLFTGTLVIVTIVLLATSVFGLFFKEEPMSLGDIITACITLYGSAFVALCKMKFSYKHSVDMSEPMKSTREKAIYGILTGNFNAIVEIPTEVVCECGFVMNPEAGFCNECGKKNPKQVNPSAMPSPVDETPDLSRLTKPAMPIMMKFVLVVSLLICLWAGNETSKLNVESRTELNESATQMDESTTQINESTPQTTTNSIDYGSFSVTQNAATNQVIIENIQIIDGAKAGAFYIQADYTWTNNTSATANASYYVGCSAYQNETKLSSNATDRDDGSTFKNRTVDVSVGESITVTEAFYLNSADDITLEVKKWATTEDSSPEASFTVSLSEEWKSKIHQGNSRSSSTEETTAAVLKGDIKSQTSLQKNLDNYGPILYQIGTMLLKNNSYNDYVNQGMSGLLTYHVQDNVGYAFVDVNYDGVDELILGSLDSSLGNLISMYYLSSSNIVSAFHGAEREHYVLCKDGIISYSGSSSASETTIFSVELTQYGLNVVNDDRAKDFYNLTDKYIPNYTPLTEYFGGSNTQPAITQSNSQTAAQQEQMHNDYDWYVSLIASGMDVGLDKWGFINDGLNGELSYYSIWDIGYALIDVNSDGINELVINIHDTKTPLCLYYWDGSGVSLAFNGSARSQFAIFSDGLVVLEEADGSDPITYELTMNGLQQVSDSRKKTLNDFFDDNSKAHFSSKSLAEWWYS